MLEPHVPFGPCLALSANQCAPRTHAAALSNLACHTEKQSRVCHPDPSSLKFVFVFGRLVLFAACLSILHTYAAQFCAAVMQCCHLTPHNDPPPFLPTT